jgi:hypothetical protein
MTMSDLTNDNTNELNTEYVLLNGNELWEIDYNKGSAIDVTEVIRMETLRLKPVDYAGSIEDYLTKQKKCKNFHFHESASGFNRAHIKTRECSFEK